MFLILFFVKIANSHITFSRIRKNGTLKVSLLLNKFNKLISHNADSNNILFYFCCGNCSTQLIKFKFMEVKVYAKLGDSRPLFCSRVAVPDALDLRGFVSNLRCLYGSDCIVEFKFF